MVDHYLRKMRLRPAEQFELESLEGIVVMVHHGLGVALVPDWLRPWPEGLKVRKLAIKGAPTCDIAILWSRNSIRLPLIEHFLEEALGCVPDAKEDAKACWVQSRRKAPAVL